MGSYRVVTPDGLDEGLTVECDAHGEAETFPPGQRKVVFHCPGCRTEIGIDLVDTDDWRELTERC